ncbi:sortase [Candidatus Dojkabacteria bacterium]|nr:sortase [Candidatus Dojkabacteria bacterium]
MDKGWNVSKQEEKGSNEVKRTRKIIAFTIGACGLLLLLSQLIPVISSFTSQKIDEFRATLLASPIPDSQKSFIFGAFAYYDPGKSYFQNLSKSANDLAVDSEYSYDFQTKQSKKIVVDKNYKKDMQLSIPKLGISKVNVTPNVDSYDENVYKLELKNGLAHFKGTPLPGDGGNSFIYGHSAVLSFFNSHKDLPVTIFSSLEKIEIGDEVIVFRDGKELKYTVRKKRTVSPDDFSVLKTQERKETLTLMTCWPVGVPTKRLIVLAERYE